MTISDDEPISPECLREINEVHRLMESNNTISASKMRSCMASKYREVQTVVYEALCTGKVRVENMPDEEIISALLNFFAVCLQEDKTNDYRCSQFEVLQWINRWIVELWDASQDTPERIDVLRQISNMLKTECIKGDKILRERVILVSFEHLFANTKLAEFFTDWLDDPITAVIYKEGIDLVAPGASGEK